MLLCWQNLHSTMLLLYKDVVVFATIKKKFTFHYASTLWDMAKNKNFVGLNLHSTMLLLYGTDHWVCKAGIEFTFHYASTLCGCNMTLTYKTKIYIPLCFYFIKIENLKVIVVNNLHSTMLLLYENQVFRKTCRRRFTFHYASTLWW